MTLRSTLSSERDLQVAQFSGHFSFLRIKEILASCKDGDGRPVSNEWLHV